MFTLLSFPPLQPKQTELLLLCRHWPHIYFFWGRLLVGSWRSICATTKREPPPPPPSPVPWLSAVPLLNHFYPLPDFQTPEAERLLMAAQGEGKQPRQGYKIHYEGSTESSGPCYIRRQEQDLPPESANQADWLILVYSLTLTNQILRLFIPTVKRLQSKQNRL